MPPTQAQLQLLRLCTVIKLSTRHDLSPLCTAVPAMHGGVSANTGSSSQSAFATHLSLLFHERRVLVLPLELELMQGSVSQVVAKLRCSWAAVVGFLVITASLLVLVDLAFVCSDEHCRGVV